MKKAALLLAILTVFVGAASADIINSTNHKAVVVVDSAGGYANSTNYAARLSVNDAFGISTSISQQICLGYLCVEFGPLGEVVRVTFLLELNISGPADDVAYVDKNTTVGIYTDADITRYYGCIEDSSQSGNPAFGLAFAGSRLNYIRLENGTQYGIRLSQNEAGNRFVLPITNGGCNTVGARMPLVFPFTPFVTFEDLLGSVEIIASYPIDLIGNVERTGVFTLILEKTGDDKITGEIP